MCRAFGAVSCALALAAAGCRDECKCAHPSPQEDGGSDDFVVQIGTVGGEDNLDFVPLEEGGPIPLETFGQGGTHATISVRAIGLGTNVAFFDVSLENTRTRAAVSTVPSSRPQLWLCDDERHVCDQLPVHVMTGGLAPPGIENRDGLRVLVTADVRTESGLRGRGSQEGALDWRPPPPRDGGVRDAGRTDDDGGDEELDAGDE